MDRRKQLGIRCAKDLPGVVSILTLLLVLAGPVRSLHAADLPLDRLFYAPEERALLDMLREDSSRPAPVAAEARASQEKPPDKPQTFTIAGTVTTKGGVKTVWFNGQPYTSASLPENIVVQRPYAAGQVVLQIPERGRSYSLRPGQTLYLGDEQIRESYEKHPASAPVNPAPARTENAAMAESIAEPGGDSPEKP